MEEIKKHKKFSLDVK